MNRIRIARFAVVLALIAARAEAGSILTFDSSRCSSGAYQYYLFGNGMTGPLSQLTAHGHTAAQTNLITAAALAGVDVFLCGTLASGTTLSLAEATALRSWVQAGGGLLYIGEGDSLAPSNVQLSTLFACADYGGQYNFFGVTDIINAPGHPLIAGPFGTVTTLTGFNVPGRWINPAPTTTVVASNPDGSGALLAFDPGAGRAVFTNDVNYFCYPPTYSASHAILWDNTIDWLLGGGVPPTIFCSGDGTATPCPCANNGAPGNGCASSVNPNGGRLAATGSASLAGDTVVLAGTGLPNAPGLYFQGTSQLNGGLGLAFGDGLRCAGGTVIRLGTKTAAAGSSQYPGPGDQSVSVRGLVTLPGTRTYQLWYRNSAAFCTISTFNLTNGLELTWGA